MKQKAAKSPENFLPMQLLFISLAGSGLCFGLPDLKTCLLHPAKESEGKRQVRYRILLFLVIPPVVRLALYWPPCDDSSRAQTPMKILLVFLAV